MEEGMVRRMEKELGMTPERAKEDLDKIRSWVNLQPHLPTLPDDEETNEWLYHLLFYSKNRPEKVKRNLECYFSCKSLIPELYSDRDPAAPSIQANVKVMNLFKSPKLTPEGYTVYFFSHSVPDPSVFNANDTLRRMLMLCDLIIKDKLTAGVVVIFYLKYSSLAHWSRYNFVTLSKGIAAMINAYPLRVKAIHFLPAPIFINSILSIPLITDKIRKRIKVHSRENIEKLLEDVPSDCLPKELGGTLDATLEELNNSTHEQLLSLREWFLSTENLKSDESKRPLEMKGNDLFGCEGTFRTLVID